MQLNSSCASKFKFSRGCEFPKMQMFEFFCSKANLRHLNGRLQTPLHLAAILNKPECLAVMAKFVKSSDVDQVDEHGRTALHLACMYDHEECVKILVSSN